MVPQDAAPNIWTNETESRARDALAEPARLRKIIHIDMDAFYASVEQRDNPELRGKPVAVGGSRERGVVAAASYEARKFGVRSAMPSVTAKRQCPDLIFVKPRFDAYKAVSLQIREIFAEHTHLIEPLSLDEAYLDVTENRKGIATATEIAEQIRAKIRAETSLTASAGVSTRPGSSVRILARPRRTPRSRVRSSAPRRSSPSRGVPKSVSLSPERRRDAPPITHDNFPSR
jgi:DNA polymerase IV